MYEVVDSMNKIKILIYILFEKKSNTVRLRVVVDGVVNRVETVVDSVVVISDGILNSQKLGSVIPIEFRKQVDIGRNTPGSNEI